MELDSCRMQLRDDANLTIIVYVSENTSYLSENHTIQSNISITTKEESDRVIEMPLNSLLSNSDKIKLEYIGNRIQLHIDPIFIIDTSQLSWRGNPDNVPNFSPVCISFAATDVLSLTSKSFTIKDQKKLHLFLNYGPDILSLPGFNLIQYLASIGYTNCVKVLSNKGADLFYDGGFSNINIGSLYLYRQIRDPHILIDCCNESQNFHNNFTKYISCLINDGRYATARSLLLNCRSNLNLNYLCEHFSSKLMFVIFTSCKNVYPDIDGDLDDKQFYDKINKIEKENRKILNNDISMNVFIEFLNRCPELVHTLFTYKELIDRFDDTLKDIASKALNTKIPRDVKDYKVTPLLSFLLGPDANTNILLKLATKNHLFFENLKSVAQKITEIEGLIYDNDPEFFNARPKSNDQLRNPFYQSH